MVKLKIFIFLVLFCILHKCEIIDAASKKQKASQLCLSPACKDIASIIQHSIDPKVAPCDDFYKFACGNFTKASKIPKDRMFVDGSTYLDEILQKQIRSILEEPIRPKEPRFITLTKNFYKGCMDTAAIKKTGVRTILGDFKNLGGWPVLGGNWSETKFDWTELVYGMRKLGYGTDYLFIFTALPDDANSEKLVLNIDQPDLFIDRPTLVEGLKNKIVSAYYSLMVDIAVIFGAERGKAMAELKDALNFEISLASITDTEEDRRNISAADVTTTVQGLSQSYPSIAWKKYLNSDFSVRKTNIVIGDKEKIIVSSPAFFKKLDKLEKPKRAVANYLFWIVARRNLQFLTDEIRSRTAQFTKVQTGQTDNQPRWKECLQITSRRLKLSVGAQYVRKYFSPESKRSAEKLAADIKQQLKEIMKKVDWMDTKTRNSALNKIDAMKNFIGYPDELLDNKKLDEYYRELVITPNDYLRASLNATLFLADYNFNRLRTPVNKSDWRDHGAVAVISAEYDARRNSIDVFAGILQGLYFNKNNPPYLNIAAVGSFIISHESFHAFDDFGSQFDENGNVKNWWTPETKKKFLQKAKCIIDQYGNYTAVEIGEKLNGVRTQGENIADNGAVMLAYRTYQEWAKQNGLGQTLPGLKYTEPQLFWINAAMQLCSKFTTEYTRIIVESDTHSLPQFRITGSFSNRPEFATDFNCPVGSKMNPLNRCSMW